ncbi:MAG: hypothetical protein A2161_11850 [Candidatus Schekmanbacteria bacterium RBG_13_48_7]|uniref:NADH dehydrogenase n=1 Tax=Candidatus Schekmanbacteria bacterium RBG_13_48_7 TaxID=1817878 RepID=A0A1F7S708_9BACT|nr:MAG: hypothetical protein A2161_11850 [Candidatus Schekmanbacteria bacterium RBG_13_48_7]
MEQKLETIFSKHPADPSSLINILHDIQKEYGYLPCSVLEETARTLKVPLSKVYSVSTFYNAFSLDKKGDKIIKICTGTACHIRGSKFLIEELAKKLNLESTGTTEDGRFTVETVNCLGACAMAPLVVTSEKNNLKYHDQVTISKLDKIIKR